MISYEPLWRTLKNKNITTYKLIKEYNFSRGMLDNLKHNRNITVETVGRLCEVLDCKVQDIIEYQRSSDMNLLLQGEDHGKKADNQSVMEHQSYVADEITKYQVSEEIDEN